MSPRKYLVPQIIELNLQAGRSFGVNIYLIDGGSEYLLVDIGQDETLNDVIDLIRDLDFPLSRCKWVIATHADADHVQALASARERIRAKTAAHKLAASAIESGDAVETYASISAQNFHIPMPPCKIDTKLKEGDTLKIGKSVVEVWHTPGHTPGQVSLKFGNVLLSGDNLYKDGCVGVIDAHHGSHIPDFIRSLERIRDDDSIEILLPSHGPAFRKDKAHVQGAIDRLMKYQYMADFGTCAVRWPLQEEWEQVILTGKMPEL